MLCDKLVGHSDFLTEPPNLENNKAIIRNPGKFNAMSLADVVLVLSFLEHRRNDLWDYLTQLSKVLKKGLV